MIIEILFILIIIVIFFILKHHYRDNFISSSMLETPIETIDYNHMDSNPEFMYKKYERDINNLFIEDDSNILKIKRPNKVLRDVNELINCETSLEPNKIDIYAINNVNNDKKCFENLTFW